MRKVRRVLEAGCVLEGEGERVRVRGERVRGCEGVRVSEAVRVRW